MAKRGADEQITKDGGGRDDSDDDNGEDPGVRSQPLAPVEGRPVRGMPKRKGMSGVAAPTAAPAAPIAKPAFSGFSFGNTGATPSSAPAPAAGGAFSFGQPAAPTSTAPASIAPSKPFAGFSFAAPNPPPAAAQTMQFGSFGQKQPEPSASAPAPAPQPTPVPAPAATTNVFATSSAPATTSRPAPSSETPPSEGEVSYYTSLRGLNSAILSFLSTTIEKDPFMNLSNVLPNLATQYNTHLDKAATTAGWRPTEVVSKASAAESSAPAPKAAMPAPPAAPSWVLKAPTPSEAPATGGFVPKLPTTSTGSSSFAFGNFGKAPPAQSAAAELAKAPEQPKAKPPSEAAELAQQVLADKPGQGGFGFGFGSGSGSASPKRPDSETSNPFGDFGKSSTPASNPFSFGSTPAPSTQPSTSTPSAESKKPAPLFSFAPPGPLHPTTPDSQTFTPSKNIEDPSPAKLGKFGPGGSQPQLSFGGAKASPSAQNGGSTTTKTFSFGFGTSAPAPSSSGGAGFSFGGAATTPSQPAAPASSGVQFGTTPTPSIFGFGNQTTSTEAPKPVSSPFTFGSATAAPPTTTPPTASNLFGFTPMSANPSSASIASGGEGGEGGEEAPLESGPPSVNLASAAGEGEENEETVFEQRGRLHKFVDGKWKAEGLGVFKMKRAKEGGKRRFLMRTDGGGNVVFNMAVQKTFKATADAKAVKFTGFDLKGQPANYMLQVKTPEMAREMVEKSLKEVADI